MADQRQNLGRETGYSTTLKMMQLMTDKGLLARDESVRPQIYRPVDPPEKTQLRLLDNLVEKGFGGSAMRLVLRAAAAKRITRENWRKSANSWRKEMPVNIHEWFESPVALRLGYALLHSLWHGRTAVRHDGRRAVPAAAKIGRPAFYAILVCALWRR